MIEAPDRRSRAGEADQAPRRSIVWMVPGIAAGIALGFLLASSFSAVDGAADLPVGLVETTETETSPSTRPAEGLSVLVPGFDSVLIAFQVFPSSTEMLVWPPRGRPYANPFPAGLWGPRFDVARDSVSLAGRGRIGRGNVLYVGNQNTVDPLATGVLGYAWHDGEPDRLAWNVAWPPDREGDVYRYRLGEPEPELVLRAAPGQQVVSWGTWGYALQTYGLGAAIQILDDGGGVIGPSTPGLLLDTTAAGTLLIEGAGESAGLRLTGPDLSEGTLLAGAAGETVAARFDPSGSLAARLARRGEATYLEVWDVEGNRVEEVQVGEGYAAEWSPDSRFVIVAERRPASLVFFDRAEGLLHRAPVEAAPQAITAR